MLCKRAPRQAGDEHGVQARLPVGITAALTGRPAIALAARMRRGWSKLPLPGA
ncbi:hypothetical protein GCM10010833_21990 [Blastomonas aquatica]|uniref:Uncharacterized protein n=1 Tax=Blastomonas aquatica TaxID=1510276 RepID=A0ABQ1JDS5_9SPHN|nr:hypothetical protein GCM10010833_21990 [Blastomonas aquatica]